MPGTRQTLSLHVLALTAALAVTAAACREPVAVTRRARLLERLDAARVEWIDAQRERAPAVRLVSGEDGPRVVVPIAAAADWRVVPEESASIAARAGRLEVWRLSVELPVGQVRDLTLLRDGGRLPDWRQPRVPAPFGWFYPWGGFLESGFYLALPPGRSPQDLELAYSFRPAPLLLVDLLGAGSGRVEASRLSTRVKLDAVERPALLLPAGAAVRFPVEVPFRGRLRFGLGRRAFPWATAAPAAVSVDLEIGEERQRLASHRMPDEAAEPGAAWTGFDVDLSRFEDESVEIVLRTDVADPGTQAIYLTDPVVVAPSYERPRPNVVVLVVDGVRADRRPWAGEATDLMPNLDRLAGRGIEFTGAHSTAPWTRPSIASMLTGVPPPVHGMRTESAADVLPRGMRTLPLELQSLGYATALLSANLHLDPAFGLSRGVSHHRARYEDGADLVSRALTWLDERPADPFFLLLFTMDTHDPWKDRKRYDDADGLEASAPGAQRLGDAASRRRRGVEEPTEAEVAKMRALYDENVRYTDEQLGVLLRGLENRGLAGRTIVIVTADHGESFGEHGDFFHGWNLYEELLHVPLVVAGPGLPRGETRTGLLSLDELPALILHLVHAPRVQLAVPAAARRMLADESRGRALFAETHFRGRRLAAVRRDRWKLIRHAGSSAVELFDLGRDPDESENLAAQRQGLTRRLGGLLDGWYRRHPPATSGDRPAAAAAPIDRELRQQLEALGYLDPTEAE